MRKNMANLISKMCVLGLIALGGPFQIVAATDKFTPDEEKSLEDTISDPGLLITKKRPREDIYADYYQNFVTERSQGKHDWKYDGKNGFYEFFNKKDDLLVHYVIKQRIA